jgi:4-amino-4-deoxy-L-arabinose transferase-like glycosyltransferase
MLARGYTPPVQATAPFRLPFTAALVLLTAVVWLEPRGTPLAEPDEARYAEIPREMLAAGDLVVPRLNGVPYLEKPPLLYWANAASLSLFGETPWAARLPTRLAGLATALLLVLGVGRIWGEAAGLAAATAYLLSPAGFLFSRVNLTDGVLSFFFALTLFLGREALLSRSPARARGLAALTGLAAGFAFLSKGLVALALPGAILLLWCLATRRLQSLVTLGLFPALPVFLAVALPWLLAAESRVPGFLQFFFVHEHFQRFATGQARRPGPITYFVAVFVAGFLPALPFFARGLSGLGAIRRWRDEHPDELFFALWFAVVFVFFSISRSKLPPYLLPAFPAAAAIAGRGLTAAKNRTVFVWSAVLTAAFVAVTLSVPGVRRAIGELGLAPIVLPAGLLLLAGALSAIPLARRGVAPATLALAAGWAAFFAGLALGWPRVPDATEEAELARAAGAATRSARAEVVGYKTYLNTFSWELKTPIAVADYTGELTPEFERRPEVREALFWGKGRFWNTWASGRPLVVLVRQRDRELFENATPPARILAEQAKHFLAANYP